MTRRAFDRFMVDVELASSTKFARLTDREKLCVLLGVWPLAAKADPRGYLSVAGQPATAADIAHHARCSVATARSTLHKLRELEMLEPTDGALEHVHDWEDYNPAPKVDRTNAERQRRYRDSHRNAPADGVSNGVTPVTVTPPEVETEEEDEAEPHRAGLGGVAEPPHPEDVRPSAAPGLTAHEAHNLVALWHQECRPTWLSAELTDARRIAVCSRVKHDAFDPNDLPEAIHGAAEAIDARILEHPEWHSEFSVIFSNRELTQAFIDYHRGGDPCDLIQAIADYRLQEAS